MSASGHERTFAVQNEMSALPPKADINDNVQFRFIFLRKLPPSFFASITLEAPASWQALRL